MLRLLDVRRIHEGEHEPAHVYQVRLDRDGTITQYEVTWTPPSEPGLPDHVDEPMDLLKDLLDYQEFAPPGQPQGVFDIPPFDTILQTVASIAHGRTLDFPIVLDER